MVVKSWGPVAIPTPAASGVSRADRPTNVADMTERIQGGRGTNWLLVWLGIALVVGILLIIAVTLVPGYSGPHDSKQTSVSAGVGTSSVAAAVSALS